jgi:hypothetical protein
MRPSGGFAVFGEGVLPEMMRGARYDQHAAVGKQHGAFQRTACIMFPNTAGALLTITLNRRFPLYLFNFAQISGR